MKDKKTLMSILILVVIIIGLVYLFSAMNKKSGTEDEVKVVANPEQCFTYTHVATEAEPNTVNEFIKLKIENGLVDGTKTGTQSGPNATNGYSGTLTGSITEDTIDVVFTYTIEGSTGQEKEIYKVREDLGGIEKLWYPLVEGKDMLIPDMTKDFRTLFYASVDCTNLN